MRMCVRGFCIHSNSEYSFPGKVYRRFCCFICTSGSMQKKKYSHLDMWLVELRNFSSLVVHMDGIYRLQTILLSRQLPFRILCALFSLRFPVAHFFCISFRRIEAHVFLLGWGKIQHFFLPFSSCTTSSRATFAMSANSGTLFGSWLTCGLVAEGLCENTIRSHRERV